MSRVESTIWGIHAGRAADAESLFLNKSVIAIGWPHVGDLSPLSPDRESFKEKIVQSYPGMKAGAVPTNAGQLYRFVHEIKIGDYVVYPSKRSRTIHIGRIVGEYHYSQSNEPEYPNRRKVEWLENVPRTQFSQGALYEIGSAMSLFQIRNYADEFRNALEGESTDREVENDETVAVIAKEIEETTRDFVIKRLAQELKGHPFEDFVAHLLQCMGYRTRVAPEGPDGGVDIIAHKDELGFEPPIIKVQVKSTLGNIGNGDVSALYGHVAHQEYGLLVTLGSFTAQARNFAKNRTNLRLIDGKEVVDLIFTHYQQFDASYKGLIPLRRVYVPEALEID
ncbi:restriction endonuclease [Tumebacillus sp. ITR2]|uniref:Restriction endonuclease n=1 Tax=Tumebacillus amylolyticus TaxID=2801339 RepID=A0ABS1JDB7_9BACL|nr:restriction endonuclease [Tumebacillus amylolyticus]MBL0388272.1 restriction endonuclease [Tumebacillus amylolyticus]